MACMANTVYLRGSLHWVQVATYMTAPTMYRGFQLVEYVVANLSVLEHRFCSVNIFRNWLNHLTTEVPLYYIFVMYNACRHAGKFKCYKQLYRNDWRTVNVWRDQEFVTKCTIKTSSGDDSDVQAKLDVDCTNASFYQETKGIVACCLNKAKQFLIVKGHDPVVTFFFYFTI